MWNHSPAFGSHHKSGDLDNKSSSPAASANAGGSANTVSSERSEAEVETWMILEYCDKGSLQVCRSSSTPGLGRLSKHTKQQRQISQPRQGSAHIACIVLANLDDCAISFCGSR